MAYTLKVGVASAAAADISGICGSSMVVGDETRTSSGASMVTNPRWEERRLSSVRLRLEEYREGKRRDNKGT